MRDQRDAARRRLAGRSTATSSAPAGPSISATLACVARRQIRSRSTISPLDDVPVDDLVDVGAVDVGVPDGVGIDDEHGSFLAAVEAARLVDAHLALAVRPSALTRPFA